MKREEAVLCERQKEVKQLEETKAGVKGLVDSGVAKLPTIFVHSLHTNSAKEDNSCHGINQPQVPVIDLHGLADHDDEMMDKNKLRKEMVKELKEAAEKWGVFQIINHGVPLDVLHDMLEGGRRFHEQHQELKKDWYSRDYTRKAIFYTNAQFTAQVPVDWRDTLRCGDLQKPDHDESIPHVCRREICHYSKHLLLLRQLMSELLSEALGLDSDYMARLGCLNSMNLLCQYYPVCPQPHLTLGTAEHSDTSFMTMLLQDTTGGLQVLHDDHNEWVDVKLVCGALIVIIGDLMQLISNDKMKSVKHRVLATQGDTARVSVACFFDSDDKLKPYGPIKETVTEDDPPRYKQTSYLEYSAHYYSVKGFIGSPTLPHFKTNII
ncbi:hypothetical protein FNV43_RR23873 [Rhamnella rubrinervis]|uniref:Fe2OG dioxygenase domain-containing protein n=1 Tax=Rhamnella rubrinervis TaxID=2594499 RepID=A0A8K0DLS0_9ROSA|nr:hypothetical protein FNV43_RR23873 [Rhamnella rubrinervis]